MKQLTQILQGATAAIGAEYFLLPIHGAGPVYRERVYCYELYHQMRLRWPPDSVYRLNGEVDKIGHPYFQDGGEPKPDLLVHEPGHGNNYAIIEVKSCEAAADGISRFSETKWDIRGQSISCTEVILTACSPGCRNALVEFRTSPQSSYGCTRRRPHLQRQSGTLHDIVTLSAAPYLGGVSVTCVGMSNARTVKMISRLLSFG